MLCRIMVVVYIFASPGLDGGIIIPLMLYTMHRCMVALKYSTFSKSEYRRYMTAPDGPVLQEYHGQAHLLPGWFSKNVVIIEYEIAAAAAAAGVPLDKMKLYMSNEHNASQWGDFVSESFGRVREERALGTTRKFIPLREACLALPSQSYSSSTVAAVQTLLDKLAKFYTITNMLIPLARPDLLDLMIPSDKTGVTVVQGACTFFYFVTSSLSTMCFSYILLCFLNSVVMCSLRQYVVSESLAKMIRFAEPLLLSNLRSGLKAISAPALEAITLPSPVKTSALPKHVMKSATSTSAPIKHIKSSVVRVPTDSDDEAEFDWLRDVFDVEQEQDADIRMLTKDIGALKTPVRPHPHHHVHDPKEPFQHPPVVFHESGAALEVPVNTPASPTITDMARATRAAVIVQRVARGILARNAAYRARIAGVVRVDDTAFSQLYRPETPLSSPGPESADGVAATAAETEDDGLVEELNTPSLSVHTPDNVFGWLYARSIMHNYGLRIRFRNDIYIG